MCGDIKMSALGDYIHLYYGNYKRYGTAKKGEQPKFANYALNVLNRRFNDIPSIDESTVNELEKRLKLNADSQFEKSKNEWAKRQQWYIDQIYKLLYERAKQVKGVDRLYNVSQGDWFSTDSQKNVSHIKTDQHWASSKSLSELKALRKQADGVYKQINTLIKKINNQKSAQSIDDLKQLENLYKEYTHLSYDSNDHTLAAIQKAIGEKRYVGTSAAIGGNFGEMFVAICDDKCFKISNLAVAEVVQTAVKGSERAEIIFDKSLIADSRGDNFLKTSTKDDTKYSLGATQNKVDVQIQINNEDVFASVKSYKSTDSKKARPDLQEVNLFTTLLFLNNYQGLQDMGNHWLNIHTTHPKVTKESSPELDEIIKKEVAFEALSSGNPFKQGVNKANVFIFINRGTGQVFVKSIKDIIETEFSTIGGLDKISSIYLDNHKSNDFQDRITNVLNQLHQQHLSIALNINF